MKILSLATPVMAILLAACSGKVGTEKVSTPDSTTVVAAQADSVTQEADKAIADIDSTSRIVDELTHQI